MKEREKKIKLKSLISNKYINNTAHFENDFLLLRRITML